MGYGIKLKVWGENACFTRPEMKAERVSYDVMTPSAARAILEAIHWKPSMRWVVDRIHVLHPIAFSSIRRNEIMFKVPAASVQAVINGKRQELAQYATEERQQRATMMLRDVAYIIEAHFVMTERAGIDNTPEKHFNMFIRRAREGQCFNQPYFGCREFPANFNLIEADSDQEPSYYQKEAQRDLGWMLWDVDFTEDMRPIFFRAEMKCGIIEVPDLLKGRRQTIDHPSTLQTL
jgi:CRISPR-associated protein Cas5d